ncbi:zinc ion binding [Striga asiatica]|uniref:Zinc ion binding n=1 Tax=Striga asiatica TaxID=4170 RepID=A0A5A7QYP5_STRAF|nr:zinc ion binding [Striga asiatica]
MTSTTGSRILQNGSKLAEGVSTPTDCLAEIALTTDLAVTARNSDLAVYWSLKKWRYFSPQNIALSFFTVTAESSRSAIDGVSKASEPVNKGMSQSILGPGPAGKKFSSFNVGLNSNLAYLGRTNQSAQHIKTDQPVHLSIPTQPNITPSPIKLGRSISLPSKINRISIQPPLFPKPVHQSKPPGPSITPLGEIPARPNSYREAIAGGPKSSSNAPKFGKIESGEDIPTAVFSLPESNTLADELRFSLVGKFSFGRPTNAIIRSYLANIGLPCQVVYLNARHVLLCFDNAKMFSKLWIKREITIQACPMRLFKWSPNFDFKIEPTIVPIWLKISTLPIHLFDIRSLQTIGALFGEFLKADDATLSKSRLNFARICVGINLESPPPPKIRVKIGETQVVLQVEYEKMPKYCHHCYHIGHDEAVCYIKDKSLRPAKLGKGKNKIPHLVINKLPSTSTSLNPDTPLIPPPTLASSSLNPTPPISSLQPSSSGANLSPTAPPINLSPSKGKSISHPDSGPGNEPSSPKPDQVLVETCSSDYEDDFSPPSPTLFML